MKGGRLIFTPKFQGTISSSCVQGNTTTEFPFTITYNFM